MVNENGDKVEIIDDGQPLEIVYNKNIGKKVIKRKIKNENGDIEDVDEIIESDITTEYDEEGNKLPKKENIKQKKEI